MNTTNFELYKSMVNSADLDKIFGIAAEEVFNAIPEDVMSKGMKETVQAATQVITPVTTEIYKNSFLSVYKSEFSDEEFGQLLGYYGPGSVLWSFFNATDFFPWLRRTIKELIQERIEGLNLASMSTTELQDLAKFGLSDLLSRLPESIRVSSVEYSESDLCRREATLGDKIAEEGNKAMMEIDWCDLLEKSGITPPED